MVTHVTRGAPICSHHCSGNLIHCHLAIARTRTGYEAAENGVTSAEGYITRCDYNSKANGEGYLMTTEELERENKNGGSPLDLNLLSFSFL